MDNKKERLYFVIEYNQSGTQVRRRTEPNQDYFRVQKQAESIRRPGFVEIENTQEDIYKMANVEKMKWVTLPELAF